MKVKTADLIDLPLDWAVAKCEGLPLRRDPMGFKTGPQAGWWVWDGEGQNEVVGHRKTNRNQHDGYSPSTNWSQGGPIIEREGINTFKHNKLDESLLDVWCAHKVVPRPNMEGSFNSCALAINGHTPLIAACRCFVASRLGDEVDVPDELV